MIKLISFIVSAVSALVTFALFAGIFAGLFAYLNQTTWNPSSGIIMLLGLTSEFLKYGGSIYVGHKIYKTLLQRLSFKKREELLNDKKNND